MDSLTRSLSRRLFRSQLGRYILYKKSLFKYYCHKNVCEKPVPKPYEIIYINPNDIQYLVSPPFFMDVSRYGTYIQSGDWDKKSDKEIITNRGKLNHRNCIPVENYGFFTSIKNYINKGYEWEDTLVHKHISDKKTIGESYKKKKKIDKIKNSIMSRGYLKQDEINQNKYSYMTNVVSEYDEILVNIDRDGHFIFEDGKHRLSVARSLGCTNIPVRVLVRHKKWQEIRSKLLNKNNMFDLNGSIKRYSNHPDIINQSSQ